MTHHLKSNNVEIINIYIIENGKVMRVAATDVLKILNLKRAWEFILDEDVISSKTDYYILSHIARLVNKGFYTEGGRVRGVPVNIGGTSYIPPLHSCVHERNLKMRQKAHAKNPENPMFTPFFVLCT